ncbi:hypothetical protein Leryth_016463 [Lithospermum erythrorhizon]|nr:hypothetical protein Leryth_016463 [Lithospermum erythrorhizon]
MRTSILITRLRLPKFTEGESMEEAIWESVIDLPCERMISAMRSSTAHFSTMESTKLKVHFVISASSWSSSFEFVEISSLSFLLGTKSLGLKFLHLNSMRMDMFMAKLKPFVHQKIFSEVRTANMEGAYKILATIKK